MALGSNQPLAEMNTRNGAWVSCKADKLTDICGLSRKCGSLDISQPYWPSWPLTAIALVLLIIFKCVYRDSAEKKAWNNFVQSVRAKLTVKSVVDGVRSGAECSFDYLLLVLTAEYVKMGFAL
jgi:hypothetical protein